MTIYDKQTLLFRDGSSCPVSAMLSPPILMEQRLLRWLNVVHQFPGDRGITLLENVIRHYGTRARANDWAAARIALVSRALRPEKRAFALALECALIESGIAPIPVPLWQTEDALQVDPDGVLLDACGCPLGAGGTSPTVIWPSEPAHHVADDSR